MFTAPLADEKEILLRLKTGDRKAFDYLFRQYYPSLVYFAKRILNDPYTAEEIAQDALLKFWGKHDRFDDLNSIKGFLYITTKNACLNYLDSQSRKTKRYEEFLRNSDENEESIFEALIYADMLGEVFQAIEKLPEQCRKIMKMSYKGGLKAKDIARELDIEISTVNSQKARGILLLKKRLSAEGFNIFLLFL